MFPSFASLDDLKSNPSHHVLDFDEKSQKTSVSPVIAPLLPEHLDNAFETVESAFKNDPLLLYIKAGQEWSPFRTVIYRCLWKFRRRRELRKKLAYTVNAGDAVITATATKSGSSKPSPIDRAFRSLELALLQVFVLHSEQTKRAKELDSKSAKVVKDELGDKIQSMFYVDLLATNPEHQGHGYATALLKAVLLAADLRGCATYLLSSNIANVPFYESFGFVRTADVLLGDDNPKWEHPPLAVALMVRQAKSRI
ncbi:hypothetical protein ACEPAI_5782 [Sanghuangporus weigelae]